MPEESNLFTEEEKQKIRENNAAIESRTKARRRNRVQEIANGLKETVNRMRPPSLGQVISKGFSAFIGKKPTDVIADSGIGTMVKRTKTRKTAKYIGMNLFKRR